MQKYKEWLQGWDEITEEVKWEEEQGGKPENHEIFRKTEKEMFRKKQVVDCGEIEQNLDGNAAHPSLCTCQGVQQECTKFLSTMQQQANW